MDDKGKSGLVFEIKAIHKCILIRKELGKPTGFEEGILKSYMSHLKRRDPLAYSRISLEWKSRRLK